MKMQWNLDTIYKGFDDNRYKNDVNELKKMIEDYQVWVDGLDANSSAREQVVHYVNFTNKLHSLAEKLAVYAELRLAANSSDEEALKNYELIQNELINLASPESIVRKWIGALNNLDEITENEPLLLAYKDFLQKIKGQTAYLLSEAEESLLSLMKTTGSSAWGKLFELLSSKLLIAFEKNGKKENQPLSVIRGMAQDADPKIRKDAYEAELAAYSQIEDSIAAALNAIKGEVIQTAKRRGYQSPLDMTLHQTRMKAQTLDAMWQAINESLPDFRRYLKHKSALLGHDGPLPFYDLFAPISASKTSYTLDDAQHFIVTNFKQFSQELADLAQMAFEKGWIDAEPRQGKVGGAFCAGIHSIGESRILTNFTGKLGDLITLGHELGHAFHGWCLREESPIHTEYPMPLAETASIFCETIIAKAVMKNADKEEQVTILENSITDATQSIVDIYSRFLFETTLFEKRKEGSLSSKRLQELMLDAQIKAYGDGLDSKSLHPYMWACKPHYYSADLNFYNFPYAFGLLFALGLYAIYQKKGTDFVEDYTKLLRFTGKGDIETVALSAGIDVTKIDFWRNSLKTVKEN
ncbi:MAG TPA: M3 family oligoendopeptidase, partial [Candidatus Marinimicrobia bacterium]|nr:M3 family oligoendopeptidase [Candidatus Neomarinimicrobiota bacterium]